MHVHFRIGYWKGRCLGGIMKGGDVLADIDTAIKFHMNHDNNLNNFLLNELKKYVKCCQYH